jgi:hypothetical protein
LYSGPLETQCSAFCPGHHAHLTHINLAGRDRLSNPELPGRIAAVFNDGLVVVRLDDGTLRSLWHHDPRRVAEATIRSAGLVTYQPRWRLVIARHQGVATGIFNVASPDEHRPCVQPEPE